MTTSAYLSGRKKYSRPQAMMWADSAPTIAASSIYAGISTTANITSGQNTMTISTGNAALLKVGYAITQSSGTGAFGLTTPIITAINTGTGQITLSVNHATSGTMTFYAGLPIYLPSGEEIGASASGDNFLILSDHNRKELSFKNTRIEKRERMINGRMRSYHIADKLTISTSWDMLPSRAYDVYPNFDNVGNSGGVVFYDFETSASTWKPYTTLYATTTAECTYDPTYNKPRAFSGTKYLMVVSANNVPKGSEFIATSPTSSPVIAGQTYTLSAYNRTFWNTEVKVAINWYSASGFISQSASTYVPSSNTSWQKITNTAVAPTGATKAEIALFTKNYDGGYEDSYWDNVYLQATRISNTVDGGAGGVDILNWYETHKDPFYVYLQYDRYDNFATVAGVESTAEYDRVKEYNEVIQMYVSDFSYSVQKRGGSNYDFWNISCSLDEV